MRRQKTADQRQYTKDESKGKYFHQIINMADDDLNPYQYRLLGHYIRVDGCWETVRATAKVTQMSVGMVVKTRNELQDLGYIALEISDHDTYLVTVVDRMHENVERYERLAREKKERSLSEHNSLDVHGMNIDVHQVNMRKFKRVHQVKQRITIEEEPKEEDKDSSALKSAEPAGTSNPSSSKGKSRKKSAPADSSDAAETVLTDTLSPQPPSPADGAAKLPSYLAVIAYNWQRNEGFAQALIGQLVGTVKNGERAKFKITPAMSREEIMAYGTWFRRRNPTAKTLPQKAEWLWESVTEFRAEEDHDALVTQGQADMVRYLMPRDETPVTPAAPKLPREEVAARLKAMQDLLLQPSRERREVQPS